MASADEDVEKLGPRTILSEIYNRVVTVHNLTVH